MTDISVQPQLSKMQADIARRVILRFHDRYENEWESVIQKYFSTFGSDPAIDYYPHLMAPNLRSKMHIVLDLYCNKFPNVNLSAITYDVFKVTKDRGL